MNHRKISYFIFLCLLSVQIYSQQDSLNMIKYTADFKFNEGIYISFDQVKNNSPIPKTRIISTVGYDNPNFFQKIIDQRRFYYYDNIGNKNEMTVKNIWGYSRNGFLYINYNGDFYRITIIGSICHFVSNYTTYSSNYNPYYRNTYYDPYYSPASAVPSTEARQYLLDFSTGRVADFDTEGVELLLMNDTELYDEYVELRRKKKRQLKYFYIRKYNEKHPLYFPEK